MLVRFKKVLFHDPNKIKRMMFLLLRAEPAVRLTNAIVTPPTHLFEIPHFLFYFKYIDVLSYSERFTIMSSLEADRHDL